MNTAVIIILAVSAALIFFFLIYLFLIKTGSRREIMRKYQNLRYAHRGLHAEGAPENSLLAFSKACDMGFGIELDVRFSKDKKLVVFHDSTLERVTEASGRVKEKTAEELKKIRLLGTEEYIPELCEVLKLVDGRVPLLIEIKEEAGECGVAAELIRILKDYNGKYIVESFNPFSLKEVKEADPSIARGMLSDMFLKDKKFRKPMYFILQSMATNIVCRPDFVSYNLKST